MNKCNIKDNKLSRIDNLIYMCVQENMPEPTEHIIKLKTIYNNLTII